jgi:hypothetical protein
MKMFEFKSRKSLGKDENNPWKLSSLEFKKHVSKHFAPFMRSNDWKGSGFVYRRINDNQVIDILEFIPNKYGGSFVIELAVHFSFLPARFQDDLAKIRVYDTEIRKNIDGEFQFPNSNNDLELLFSDLENCYINDGEPFFNQFDNWKDDFAKLTPIDVENYPWNFELPTKIRMALLLAHVNSYLGNKANVIELAEYGMAKIDGPHGSALRPEFETLIKNNS